MFRIYVCAFVYVSVICMALINNFVPDFSFEGYNIFWVGGGFIFAVLYLTNFWRYGISLDTCRKT